MAEEALSLLGASANAGETGAYVLTDETGAHVVNRDYTERLLAKHIQQGRFIRLHTGLASSPWCCTLYVDGLLQSYGRFNGYLGGDELGLITASKGGVKRLYSVTALGIAKFFYDCVEHDDCFVNPALGRECRLQVLSRASAAPPETLP